MLKAVFLLFQAEAIALTVAQAFTMAYEEWEVFKLP